MKLNFQTPDRRHNNHLENRGFSNQRWQPNDAPENITTTNNLIGVLSALEDNEQIQFLATHDMAGKLKTFLLSLERSQPLMEAVKELGTPLLCAATPKDNGMPDDRNLLYLEPRGFVVSESSSCYTRGGSVRLEREVHPRFERFFRSRHLDKPHLVEMALFGVTPETIEQNLRAQLSQHVPPQRLDEILRAV